MDNRAYDTAAGLIHQYLHYDPKIVELFLSNSPDSQSTRDLLKKSEVELREIVHREFDAAIAASNEPEIIKLSLTLSSPLTHRVLNVLSSDSTLTGS